MKKMLFSALLAAGLTGPALAQQPAPADPAAAPTVMSCDPCCCQDDCCRRGTILADVGFLILKPYWKTNPALFIDDGVGAGTVEQKDFTDATQFVPRVYLGALNANGLGARIGWWGFATSQTDFIANPDGTLAIDSASPLGLGIDDTIGGMAASMALRMNVWDFEALRLYQCSCWSFLLSGGIRYAHMSQDYNAVEFEDDGGFDEIVLSGHNFNGAGPTIALQAQRAIGDALYLSSLARGALLFGQGEQTVTLLDDGGAEVDDVAHASYDMVLPVVEIELGAGYRRPVRRSVAFVEAGVNAQAWIDAGNVSRSQGLGEEGAFLIGNISDPTLGLLGFYAKAGLTY